MAIFEPKLTKRLALARQLIRRARKTIVKWIFKIETHTLSLPTVGDGVSFDSLLRPFRSFCCELFPMVCSLDPKGPPLLVLRYIG
jgi:hypothetical protein